MSKLTHWAQACRSLLHFEHRASAVQAEATVSSLPHLAQRTTSHVERLGRDRGLTAGGVFPLLGRPLLPTRLSRLVLVPALAILALGHVAPGEFRGLYRHRSRQERMSLN